MYYDGSSQSNTFKEGKQTEKARSKIILMCQNGFRNKGLKLMKIVEEVPATFPDKKYHADFGISLSTLDYDKQYFFIIEIDGKIGHGTKTTSAKECDRDELFEREFGVITIRTPLEDLTELNSFITLGEYFSSNIWNPFFFHYIQPSRSPSMEVRQYLNQTFASKISNNNSTKCPLCPHLNDSHDLGGCDYRFALDDFKKCSCTTSFLRSDK